MKHEKEIVEKQLRQQKEEEKRLKLERLKQKLDNFEEEVLTGQVIKELRTCWEVCTEWKYLFLCSLSESIKLNRLETQF
jgi:hypothetical protein